jgi:FKBP-type peptidyl-prolyl cis-trans isomerase 2
MALKKNDFVEIEYTGRIKGGEIFDTNIKSDAEKINLNVETKPLIICIGQRMILPAIDDFLIGKDAGEYKLELAPEQAFGKRNKEFIKTVPIGVFKNQTPSPGMVFHFDGLIGKITSVSGGRVTIDFNNPLAGKEVEYTLKVKREVTNVNEKIKAFLFYYAGKDFKFNSENGKVTVECSSQEQKALSFLKPKFKEIFSLELELAEPKAAPQNNPQKLSDKTPKTAQKLKSV